MLWDCLTLDSEVEDRKRLKILPRLGTCWEEADLPLWREVGSDSFDMACALKVNKVAVVIVNIRAC